MKWPQVTTNKNIVMPTCAKRTKTKKKMYSTNFGFTLFLQNFILNYLKEVIKFKKGSMLHSENQKYPNFY